MHSHATNSKAEPTLVVSFSGSVAGSRFEKSLTSAIRGYGDDVYKNVQQVIFDFSNSSYVDPYSMQLLIAYLNRFELNGINFSLRLPRKKGVRDTMRAWGLDYALITSLDRSIFSICTQEDKKQYFSDKEKQSTFNLACFPKGSREFSKVSSKFNDRLKNKNHFSPPRASNFFGFHSFDVADIENKVGMAKNEKNAWQDNNISRFFRNKMGVDSKYLSSRIIYEALFNSLRHSNASIVQTATHTQLHSSSSNSRARPEDFSLTLSTPDYDNGEARSMVIHYWDDGESMLDIFSQKLTLDDEDVRTGDDPEYYSKYRVRYKDKNNPENSDERVIDSDMPISSATPDYLKVVSLAFPYVSSSPTKSGHAVAEEVEVEEDHRLATRGMGLYLLIHATTKILGGKVAIRSGNQHIEFSKGSSPTNEPDSEEYDYDVLVWKLESELPKFVGNLISVRISSEN